eukprot:CAMPEP_0117667324 /NCGR_PEP_ID=MMETSP0804-20121206/10894_1 /TAXON_ID=1074897 /ORGANISM="Tetraselmis astigmatica, Strain CCMP880" /LENGTH=139 /DNA_ID=CAMNT_0005475019 /DNA_START=160 /DNA_END=579 /DNA_ORIENTATION=+
MNALITNVDMMCSHGQTVLLAVALSSKEGTVDYEWQLQQYLEAASVPPHLLLTDADPGVTAAIATVLPYTLHLWCLWHLLQNLRNNLGSKLGNEYMKKSADFRQFQQHMSQHIFWEEWSRLKERWPEARLTSTSTSHPM